MKCNLRLAKAIHHTAKENSQECEVNESDGPIIKGLSAARSELIGLSSLTSYTTK